MLKLNANRIFIDSAVILGYMVLGAVYIFAQTGGIAGEITDSAGAVIAGAEIKAVIAPQDQASMSRVFSARSNLEGKYTIPNLPAGIYEVEVKYPGFMTSKKKVAVTSDNTTRLDLQITPPEACGDATGPNIELAENDKVEIINQVLKMEFQSHPILRQEMVLSTQNIKAAWVSTSPGQKVIPLPLLEILKKAHANGSVDYYYFSELQIHGDCVSVTLSNSSKIFKEGLAEDCTLCGGGTTYTFRKEAGSWKGGYFIGWVH